MGTNVKKLNLEKLEKNVKKCENSFHKADNEIFRFFEFRFCVCSNFD